MQYSSHEIKTIYFEEIIPTSPSIYPSIHLSIRQGDLHTHPLNRIITRLIPIEQEASWALSSITKRSRSTSWCFT